MPKVKFGKASTKYDALNVYRQESFINGVLRPSLSIEFDDIEIIDIYNEWESIEEIPSVTVSSDIAEEVFEGYNIPVSLSIVNKEIERETLTTASVIKKVITLVVATKTTTEIKAEPTNNALAASSNEILQLRNQVRDLQEALRTAV